MRILVTGASGRLGRYVVAELAGHELVLFSRHAPDADVVGPHTYVQGDLTQYADVQRAMAGVHVVQHLGAVPFPSDHPEAERRARRRGMPFDATIRTNLLGTYYVLRAAAEEGARAVVMAGSNCALGPFFRISGRPYPVYYLPLDEEHPTDVEDSYSFSKLAAEEMLAAWTRAYGMRTYALRLGYICDADARARLARRARRAEGWPAGMWTWVSAEDSARAHRTVMEAALSGDSLPPHEVFLVVADDTFALEPSTELVERFRPDLCPLVRGLPGHASFMSNARLKRATGWRHREGWRHLLR